MPILDLPRFTLLSGPLPTTHAFSAELISRSHSQLVQLDFCDPILSATADMLYDHDEFTDFADPSVWLKYIPFSTKYTLTDWIVLEKDSLRNKMGPDILGRIFLHNYLRHDWESLWPTIIIRDFDHLADAQVLIDKFGRGDLLCVNLGPLTQSFPVPNCRTTWLADPDPAKAVDALLLELKQSRIHA